MNSSIQEETNHLVNPKSDLQEKLISDAGPQNLATEPKTQRKADSITPPGEKNPKSSMRNFDELRKLKAIPYLSLFKYTTRSEKFLLFLAYFFSLAQGGLTSSLTVIFGNVTGDMTPSIDHDKMLSLVSTACLWGGIFGVCQLSCATIGVYLWRMIGKRIECRVRQKFFKKILKQDTAWYDVISPEKITAIYSEDTSNYIKALGQMNHILLMTIGSILAGFGVGFTISVIYTLIMLITAPFVAIGTGVWLYGIKKGVTLAKESYIDAGGLAEQAIYGIRTVKSLNGEEHELGLYERSITKGWSFIRKYGIIQGIGFGTFNC
jgi:ATP-binding cassette subfamily B (MDR/TAP) protein 1